MFDVDTDRGIAAANRINGLAAMQGGAECARFWNVDVSDAAAVRAAVNSCASWGSELKPVDGYTLPRIDTLVNNAAVFRFATPDTVSDEDWNVSLGVNIKGYSNCL